ncbi:MAG TPA: hypothetical protein VL240_04410 [Candidatus Binatia bacterium]|nr:hypothetical protein [Candidatus Binatia bacterium]
MTTSPVMFAAASLLGLLAASLPAQEQASSGRLAHTRTEFSFTANASFERTAPLFGANEERKWSPDWNPQFVYPNPAQDRQGMVFQVAHGAYASTWVNTAFDPAAGHIQYAYVLSDAMVTLIDIHLTREGEQKTGVTVVYERTALMPEANDHVQHFARQDEKAGKQWEEAINRYLKTP